MIEQLVGSKLKVRMLRLFAERGELHVSAVARELGASKSRVSVCLRELEKGGLLQSRRVGRSVAYRLAPTKRAEAAVQAISEQPVQRAIERAVVAALRALKPVSIVLFGSVARRGLRSGSDVDILVVSERRIGGERLASVAARLTVQYGFPISIIEMGVPELRRKVREGEEFALNVMADEKVLYGKRLEDVAWPEK